MSGYKNSLDYKNGLMPPEEAAQLMGLEAGTLYLLRLKHKGPRYILHDRWAAAYRVEDIVQWMNYVARRYKTELRSRKPWKIIISKILREK